MEWQNSEGAQREKGFQRRKKKSPRVIYLKKKKKRTLKLWHNIKFVKLPNYSGKYMNIHYLVLITFQCFEIFHNKKENRCTEA